MLSQTSYIMILSTAFILFFCGVVAFAVKRNLLVMLMSIELMLNSVNLVFILFNRMHGGQEGNLFVLMIMLVAAAEVAIGISIIINIFRHFQTLSVDHVDSLNS